MNWVLVVGAAWVLLAVAAAWALGRAIGIADRKAADAKRDRPNFVVDGAPRLAQPTPLPRSPIPGNADRGKPEHR